MKCRACVLGLSFVAAVCIAESASAYYNSSLGRFVSRDPIGYRGGINLYEFLENAPLAQVDPDGTMTRDECFKAVRNAEEKMNAYIDAMGGMKPPCLAVGKCYNGEEGKCKEKGGGGYVEAEITANGKRIITYVVCYENASVNEIGEVAAHELIHVFDLCSGCKSPPTKDEREKGVKADCAQLACTELRAACLSGQCSATGEYRKQLSNAAGRPVSYEECVKVSAVMSLRNITDCEPRALEHVNGAAANPQCLVKEGTDLTKPVPWPVRVPRLKSL
ncbi:MAG TPA: hypothetical protein DD670_07520 [Planctomycetaceae bacterium]|nr:hypothetical protein [Planctomycetaceae bacterium]